jgi:hydroxyacylglutathione hydrolase
MILEKVKTPGLAQIGYLLGDKGQAVVVDPRRDVEPYLELAAKHGLAIHHVIETHRQEDYVIGSAELARRTGAKVVNGCHELFGRGDIRLGDGEELALAGYKIRALHTPGHTPEGMCYAVFLDDVPDIAWGVFTGDSLFIGETGRTDLPDPLRTGENAGRLYDAIHSKLLPLGEQTQLWPAHGSGSVCGGRIADRDESTLGLERQSNPVFVQSRSDFVAAKIAERIPRPPYFELMERLNLEGGAPLAQSWTCVRVLSASAFQEQIAEGIVIDARDADAFACGHVPNSYSIWLGGLSVFAGWIVKEGVRVFLVLPEMRDLESAVLALARVGVDKVEGVLAGGFAAWRNAGLPVARITATMPSELSERASRRVLDVRDDREFEEGHIAKASHLYVGYVERSLDRVRPGLERREDIVVTCSVGHRASLASSILLRQGYPKVFNLLGGMTAWNKLDLPTAAGSNELTTFDIEGRRT